MIEQEKAFCKRLYTRHFIATLCLGENTPHNDPNWLYYEGTLHMLEVCGYYWKRVDGKHKLHNEMEDTKHE